jgi:ABC-type Fe3+/spermidine/putrescine transport system ATPase subunit
MPLLEIRNLSQTYSDHKKLALSNINFAVKKGEILSIAGESGSGKSTLLKLTAGLQDPLKGEILFNGERVKGPIYNLVPGHPEITLVHQQFDLEPNLNVYKNLETVLRDYHAEYRMQRIEELLDSCKLRNLQYQKPSELSGGEQQRVAIARAIGKRPNLLLLDEPFSNQDVFLKEKLKITLYDLLKKYEVTTILVTHDTRDALSMADRVAVLHEGEVLQIDTSEKIYSHPKNCYVASFFGPANIFKKNELVDFFKKSYVDSKNNFSFICIRAEDIRFSQISFGTIEGKIIKVRFYGSEKEYEVTSGNKTLKVLTRREVDLSVGEKVGLQIDWDKIIYLDS